jgi:hypothetical protein
MRDLQWLFPLRGKWLGWLLVPVLAFLLPRLMLDWWQFRFSLPTLANAAPGSVEWISSAEWRGGGSLGGHSGHSLWLGPFQLVWTAKNFEESPLSAAIGVAMDLAFALCVVLIGRWIFERGRRSTAIVPDAVQKKAAPSGRPSTG